jgi:hypothetical protein
MTYDASNRKQVRAKEKEAGIADRNRIAYTKRIMSDQPGREWMHSLLESCYIFGEPFVAGAPDATAHNLGKQIIGKQIFADIVTNSPTEYVLMMQEASIKEILNDRRDSDNRSPVAGERSSDADLGRDDQGSRPPAEWDYDPTRLDEDTGPSVN